MRTFIFLALITFALAGGFNDEYRNFFPRITRKNGLNLRSSNGEGDELNFYSHQGDLFIGGLTYTTLKGQPLDLDIASGVSRILLFNDSTGEGFQAGVDEVLKENTHSEWGHWAITHNDKNGARWMVSTLDSTIRAIMHTSSNTRVIDEINRKLKPTQASFTLEFNDLPSTNENTRIGFEFNAKSYIQSTADYRHPANERWVLFTSVSGDFFGIIRPDTHVTAEGQYVPLQVTEDLENEKKALYFSLPNDRQYSSFSWVYTMTLYHLN